MIINKYLYVALGIVALSAASLAFWSQQSADLNFKERAFPAGFRELMLQKASSIFDPILGLQHAQDRENKSKLGTRDICDAIFRDPLSPTLGNANGNVQIAEFFDYRCPYCKTLTKILSEMAGSHNIQIVYKEWPILGDSSVLAARAALTAAKQRKYVDFHVRLMNSRLIPNSAYLGDLARELGMNLERLCEDMNSNDTTLSDSTHRHDCLRTRLFRIASPSRRTNNCSRCNHTDPA